MAMAIAVPFASSAAPAATAAGAGAGAGAGAVPPAASAPATDPSVHIRLWLDDQGRLMVRYAAPPEVSTLSFVDRAPRLRDAVAGSMMKSFDACGTVSATGITLGRTGSCLEGATFVVTPATLDAPGTREPAQPTSDHGVLTYTGAWAAAAPGRPLRWEFVAPKNGYVLDDGARANTTLQRETVVAPAIPGAAAGQAGALHAAHYVYLGTSPFTESGGFALVRDPALPEPLVGTMLDTLRDAAAAWNRVAAPHPDGPVTVVMLAVPRREGARFGGDQGRGRVLRLAFVDTEDRPTLSEVEGWRVVAAHELARLWLPGPETSDPAAAWLAEGDAEWIAVTTLAASGGLAPAGLKTRLESAVNACLLARGNAPAAAKRSDWQSHDDPLACGLALQLLAWAQHSAPDGPIAAWADTHRRFPSMTAAQFAANADAALAPPRAAAEAATPPAARGGTAPNARSRKPAGKGAPGAPAATPAPAPAAPTAPSVTTLLTDPAAPFADTYLRALSAWLPLSLATGEPAEARLREGLAQRLFTELILADCEAPGFTVRADDLLIDKGLACRHVAPGRRVVSIAGDSPLAHPTATWRRVAQQCALHGEVTLGFSDWRDETIACPAALSPVPARVQLPDDAPARLRLAN
jgi:hypothetical protein